ncbi:MAG: hypothetical protein AB1351_10640 [Thermoproteota archaeon]
MNFAYVVPHSKHRLIEAGAVLDLMGILNKLLKRAEDIARQVTPTEYSGNEETITRRRKSIFHLQRSRFGLPPFFFSLQLSQE